MNIEKVNDFWVPTKGISFMQDKCLKSFLKYCSSQNKKFKRVLDIGAWCGACSIIMEKHIMAIDAFEPDKTHFACLEKNVARFSDRIKSNRVAIGDKDCLISLTDERRIPMHTVDHFNYSDVDFIKIDVERDVMRVLEGAKKTITFNDENQSNVQYIMIGLDNSSEVKKYITSLGFKVLINIWPDIVYYRP
jgi:hypothetical protein